MVSCHLTEPNYKTTQPCAHGWGARPPVTTGKIDDVGVTCRAETHPDIIAPLSAHVKKEGCGGVAGPCDTTHTHIERYTILCVAVKTTASCV